MPDLIAALRINGRGGFIKKIDLEKIHELATLTPSSVRPHEQTSRTQKPGTLD